MVRLAERLAAVVEGRYEILEELGRGGMSIVFHARDLRHDRDVAIKVLLPELAVSVGGQRFLREIEIAARLVHPHILPLYDSGEGEGLLFHVTPSIQGETLRDRLKRERYLSVEDAVRITAEVADALDFAHERGVIHRDIKPDNVLLARRHALITDFGVARAISAGAGPRLTETGMAVGTPAYMSPEQARGEETLDGRSDIYSLACCTYEMLAGEAPLSGRTPQVTMTRRQSESPSSLRILRETVPEGLDVAVLKGLARLPVDRFSRASEFADAVLVGSGTVSGAHGTVTSSGRMAVGGAPEVSGSEPARGLSFWEELKRRKVYNVGLVYLAFLAAATDWVSNTFPTFNLEGWVTPAQVLLILGLPVSLLLAWTFEVSREGVTKTGTYELTETRMRRWPVISRRALIGVVVIIALYVAWQVSRRLAATG